ncbi:MAG: PQQ-dependent sugar dehydrogenase, partial [Acidobacteriaceae bacterium]|nr:PQQ-dependent sugar dehydrogenase [Acidobacteriaceae bacterium]
MVTAHAQSNTQPSTDSVTLHTGQSSFHDWTQEKPGERWKTVAADLPAPYTTESADNGPTMAPRPKNAWPQAPAGFKVELYQDGIFVQPRLIRAAPNGDLFIADSWPGKIVVLRGADSGGRAAVKETFAKGLDHPFGIAFYPPGPDPKWVYVANTSSLVRFPYKNGDLKATRPAETVIPVLPGYAKLRGGGHWTRDVVFSPDGKRMFVSVGSYSNVDDADNNPQEFHRANVLEYTPEGKFIKIYASGLRNCVGEAINPVTSQLWCSTNERDRLG